MTLQARLEWGASTNCLRPELNWIFKKLLNDNCIHVDPQNFLWVNIEIIDPLVPKDISRRGGLRSLPFSNRWVSVSQMTVERGEWEAKSAVYHWMFPRVGLAVKQFAGEAGFPGLRRLMNNNRQQQTDWRSTCYLSKIFAQRLLEIFRNCNSSFKIDELSKLRIRICVSRLDGHPDGVLEMLFFNRLDLRTAATGFAGISSNAALHQQLGCVWAVSCLKIAEKIAKILQIFCQI